MKIFLSWSQDRSKAMATALRDWLPLVLHYVEPWLSDKDILAGERWSIEVAKELDTSYFGIICVTRENLDAPWVLFEAGALSKALNISSVCPYLLDVDFREIIGPLSQFQAKKADKVSTFQMVQAINNKAIKPDDPARVAELFEALWPKLEQKLAEIPNGRLSDQPIRTQQEILEELITAVRNTDQRFRRVEQTVFGIQALLNFQRLGGHSGFLVRVSVECTIGRFIQGDQFFVYTNPTSVIEDIAVVVGVSARDYDATWWLWDKEYHRYLNNDELRDNPNYFDSSEVWLTISDVPF